MIPDYLGLQTRKIVALKASAWREISLIVPTELTTPLETLASGESPLGIDCSDSWPSCWLAAILGSCEGLFGGTILGRLPIELKNRLCIV